MLTFGIIVLVGVIVWPCSFALLIKRKDLPEVMYSVYCRVTALVLLLAVFGLCDGSAYADTEVKESMGVLSVVTPVGETGKFELTGLSGGKTFSVTSTDSMLTKLSAVGSCQKAILIESVTCSRDYPFTSVVVQTSGGNDVVNVDLQPNAYPVAQTGQEPFKITTGDGNDSVKVAVAMISAFDPGLMPVALGNDDDTFDGSKSTGVSFDVTPGFGNDTVIGSAAVNSRSSIGDFRYLHADRFNAEAVADGRDTFSDPTYFAQVSYAKRTNKVNVSLDNVANDGYVGEQDDVQTTIETVRGGVSGDTIDLSQKNVNRPFSTVVAFGGGGDDDISCKETTVIDDGSYECALLGEDGNDTLDGADTGYEMDFLLGGKGNDVLRSNDTKVSTGFAPGALDGDTLIGGDGADTMVGGKGSDSFFLSGTNGLADGDDIVKNDGKNLREQGDFISYSKLGYDYENWDFGGLSIWLTSGYRYHDIYAESQNETSRTTPVHVTLDGKANDGAVDGENDNIENETVEYVRGGSADDHLDGEKVFGRGGRGGLAGAAGNDHLENAASFFGGEGDDLVLAASSGSVIEGNQGKDTLLGRAGADRIYGKEGDDTLDGGDGDDMLEGGRGSDKIKGGAGEDTLRDENYPDTYDPASGSLDVNELDGGLGDDKLEHFESNQLVRDIYHGGEGDDLLTTALVSGRNSSFNPANKAIQLYGDAGDDTIRAEGKLYSRDIGHGGEGNDKLYLGNASGDEGNDQLFGYAALQCSVSRQDDVVDTLQGGSGNDWLVGGGGADSLTGGSGDDLLVAGYACGSSSKISQSSSDRYTQDELSGENGADTLVGGTDDVLVAGEGNDTVQVKSDNEYQDQRWVGEMFGGEGSDTVGYGSTKPEAICSVRVSLDNQANDGSNVANSRGERLQNTHNVHDDIEHIDGTRCDDELIGNSGANVLDGGAGGKDTLKGLAGVDILRGSADGSATIFARDGERDEVSCGPAHLGLSGYAEIDLQDLVTNCNRVDNGHKVPETGEVDRSSPTNPSAQSFACVVRNLKGVSISKASDLLSKQRCVMQRKHWWVTKKTLDQKVLSQSLKPGKYQAGSKIMLRVGKKSTVTSCRISRIVGKTLTAGTRRLQGQQCNIDVQYQAVRSRALGEKILAQSARGVVRSATTVRITIGITH